MHALCFISVHEKRDGQAANHQKDLGQPTPKLAMLSDQQTTPDRPIPTPPDVNEK